jgi:hypothetical protein|tara:strand:- start:231 stop:647 length:417 start_codon:yes stop_codon:yes gene_type:complete
MRGHNIFPGSTIKGKDRIESAGQLKDLKQKHSKRTWAAMHKIAVIKLHKRGAAAVMGPVVRKIDAGDICVLLKMCQDRNDLGELPADACMVWLSQLHYISSQYTGKKPAGRGPIRLNMAYIANLRRAAHGRTVEKKKG